MEYFDFQIRAWKIDEQHVQLFVHSSPVGNMRTPVTVRAELGKLRESLDFFCKDDQLFQSANRGYLVELGRQLGVILLPRPVYALLLGSLDQIGHNNGLRLRLCFDETLVDLPWEYLYYPDVPGRDSLDGFVVLDKRISLVREAPSTFLKPRTSKQKQRMVVVGTLWAGGEDRWGVREEYEKLKQTLSPVSEILNTEFIEASGDHIEQGLQRPMAIFHYSGHTDDRDGRAFLLRIASDFVAKNLLYSEHLGELLRQAGTRLAVFSACNSGRWSFVEPLLRTGLPAVISAQGLVTTLGASAFCGALYSTLASGLSLDEAVTGGRFAVLHHGAPAGKDTDEWGRFMVYLPTAETILFPRPNNSVERERKAAARQKSEETIADASQATGIREERQPLVDKTELRKALVDSFSLEELKLLCADMDQKLKNDGFRYQVNLELVAGETLESKTLALIEYLYRRGILSYLVNAVRKERAGRI